MPSVCELGVLAEAVYNDLPLGAAGWSCIHFRRASAASNGFQASTFQRALEIVVAFRGTAQAMDGVADLKLGTGMNSSYFSDGEAYVSQYLNYPNVFLCGHSLGGAIAQVVANRGGFRFASFNAPGVAVFASRNLDSASLAMTAIRTVGMVASVARHPIQAAQDVRATFNTAKGLNVCLQNDIVSQIGLHYGRVIRIPGESTNPLTEHKIETMNRVLRTHPVGSLRVETF